MFSTYGSVSTCDASGFSSVGRKNCSMEGDNDAAIESVLKARIQ